jgi:hypothetical protein
MRDALVPVIDIGPLADDLQADVACIPSCVDAAIPPRLLGSSAKFVRANIVAS